MNIKTDQTDKKLLKLPVGIQTFEQLIRDGYIYVDKTKYLINLIEGGKVYFLSRPRRFGKSLTISTFDALFSGKKELFKGLYAEEFFERPEYRTYPVVHLDMSKAVTNRGVNALEESILRQVKRSASLHGVSISYDSPADALGELLTTLGDRGVPVAVLVDEYDKPILDVLKNHALAEEYRDSLRNFYTQIKAEDASIKFVFITGITKFTRTGVFSTMNNLYDISMDPEYATMLGYTEGELISYFSGYIDLAAEKFGLEREVLFAQVKDYYDGFSFDGINRLYNPFSTLSFLKMKELKNFWFDSGSPSFLIEYVKTHDIEAEDFRGMVEHEDFTSVTEIEMAKPSSFLFQSGYLTVREKKGARLTLDYPNKEVLSSMANLFMYSKYENQNSGSMRLDLETALAGGDAEALVMSYRRTLAAIPYDIHAKEEKKYELDREKGDLSMSNIAESFYHAVLFTMLWASGVTTLAESYSYRGRSDIEVLHKEHFYVIELKVADGAEASARAADDAMAQIHAKGYAEKYKGARLIGMAVDRQARQVGAYKIL